MGRCDLGGAVGVRDVRPENGPPQSQRLRRSAAFMVRSDNTDRSHSFHRLDQRAQAFRLDTVVVGNQNVCHLGLSNEGRPDLNGPEERSRKLLLAYWKN